MWQFIGTQLWCCLFFDFRQFLILENLIILDLAPSGVKGFKRNKENSHSRNSCAWNWTDFPKCDLDMFFPRVTVDRIIEKKNFTRWLAIVAVVAVWLAVVAVWLAVVAVWLAVVAVWLAVVAVWLAIVAVWLAVVAVWLAVVAVWLAIVAVWLAVVAVWFSIVAVWLAVAAAFSAHQGNEDLEL